MGDKLLSDEGGWEGLLSGGKYVMQMRRMRNISSKMLGNCRNSKTVYICYYEQEKYQIFPSGNEITPYPPPVRKRKGPLHVKNQITQLLEENGACSLLIERRLHFLHTKRAKSRTLMPHRLNSELTSFPSFERYVSDRGTNFSAPPVADEAISLLVLLNCL